MRHDVVKQKYARGSGTFNSDGQAGDTLEISAERCQVDIPLLP